MTLEEMHKARVEAEEQIHAAIDAFQKKTRIGVADLDFQPAHVLPVYGDEPSFAWSRSRCVHLEVHL